MSEDFRFTSEDLVREARSWIGTPYVAQAAMKGVGADCVGLIIGVWKACGLIPQDYSPGAYEENDAGKLVTELVSLGFSEVAGNRLEACSTGCVLVLELPMARRHCAIVSEVDGDRVSIVHVYGRKRGVTEHVMDAAWWKRVESVWRWQS